MPHAFNFDSSTALSSVSKAFDKSRNIPSKFFLAVNGVSNFVHEVDQAWEEEGPGRKPN